MTITINGTTGIAGVDGSASTPAFQGNDPDTGIFYPAANTVAAAAGGATVWNAASTFGFKNRLINGNFDIWQRGTSFTGSGSITYYADRWSAVQFAGSSSTISRQSGSGLAGSLYVLRAQRPNGATNTATINLSQSIETANSYDLAGQTVTLSFKARAGSGFSAASSILGCQIVSGTGTDQNVYGSYTGGVTFSQNNTLTTSWQTFTQTVTFASNVNEAAVVFFYTPVGTAGANDFYEIGQVQLEIGPVATSFDFRSIGTELALCQRYYVDLANNGGSVQNLYRAIGFASTYTTTQGTYVTQVPVPMRVLPSLSQAGTMYLQNLGTTSVSSFAGPYSLAGTVIEGDFTMAGAVTANITAVLRWNNSSTQRFAYSAEL